MYTGVSERKVDDVISTFNKEGTAKVYTRQKPHTYASLCDEDIQVSSFYPYAQQLLKPAMQHLLRTLEATPDLFLDELCQDLELQTGKSVSASTIWRTLRRAGYTMKKVHHNILSLYAPEGDLNHIGSSHVLPWNVMLRLVPSLLLALETIALINLYSLMRVPLTAEQHTVGMLGQ